MIEFSKGMFGFVAAMLLTGAVNQQTFSGKITSITPETIEVSNGHIKKKFRRTIEPAEGALETLPAIRVGDQVVVKYSLDADAIRLEKQSAGRAAPGKDRQAPGQTPDKNQSQKPGQVPGQVPGTIDDRAFYES